MSSTRLTSSKMTMHCHLQAHKRKLLLLVLGCLSVLLLRSANEVYQAYDTWWHTASDSIKVMQWMGFGPEKGLYNFTVVTAMLDIGRGSWGQQARPYNTYLLYMQRMLRLDVNLVVFVDTKGKPFIDWMRRGREQHTHIVISNLQALPYYRLKNQIAEIMDSAQYKKDNELVAKHLCEAFVPEYDILQLSKLYFMDRTVRANPFLNNYFIWLDAGYGHGLDVHPVNGVWKPKSLFEYPNQITFINRDPGVMAYMKDKDKLHKMSINILAGMFFGGGGEALKELYQLQQKQVEAWMREGIIDDDQTMYMLLYYQKPTLFHLVPGDWYDVFTLFNTQDP